jgi:DHA1 family multidrug resistance protein-like MFS transporter
MENYIRDTVFGDTVRLLSSNRLLKFPDEQDPASWKQYTQEGSTIPALTLKESAKYVNSINDQTNSAAKEAENVLESPPPVRSSEHVSSGKEAVNSNHTKYCTTRHVILVDWYGPRDPEVITFNSLLMLTNADISGRILKIGRHAANYS